MNPQPALAKPHRPHRLLWLEQGDFGGPGTFQRVSGVASAVEGWLDGVSCLIPAWGFDYLAKFEKYLGRSLSDLNVRFGLKLEQCADRRLYLNPFDKQAWKMVGDFLRGQEQRDWIIGCEPILYRMLCDLSWDPPIESLEACIAQWPQDRKIEWYPGGMTWGYGWTEDQRAEADRRAERYVRALQAGYPNIRFTLPTIWYHPGLEKPWRLITGMRLLNVINNPPVTLIYCGPGWHAEANVPRLLDNCPLDLFLYVEGGYPGHLRRLGALVAKHRLMHGADRNQSVEHDGATTIVPGV